MVIKVLKDEEAEGFIKDRICPACERKVLYIGSGQAGIHRVVCYHCPDCDILYQVITTKKGAPMFEEVEMEGKRCLAPDKEQRKCNVCACRFHE